MKLLINRFNEWFLNSSITGGISKIRDIGLIIALATLIIATFLSLVDIPSEINIATFQAFILFTLAVLAVDVHKDQLLYENDQRWSLIVCVVLSIIVCISLYFRIIRMLELITSMLSLSINI